jgi:osmotically-inducible protein OsmY
MFPIRLESAMPTLRDVLVATMIGSSMIAGCTALTEKSPKEAVSDAGIVTRAKALLAADPLVKARNIHVTAVKGDVMLAGLVKSPEEADRAVELVRGIPGVNTVASTLKVG